MRINAKLHTEDERLHLGVPATGLVTEVHTCLEKLLHRNDCHSKITSKICFASAHRDLHGTSGTGGLPSTQKGTKGHSDACVMLCYNSTKRMRLQVVFSVLYKEMLTFSLICPYSSRSNLQHPYG